MRHTKTLCSWLIGAAVLFAALESMATTVLWAPADKLAERSELSLRGEVTAVSVIEVPGGMEIYTEYQVDVLDTYKGPDNERVVIRIPGGKVGDRSLEFHGAPTLEAGTEYVLLLEGVPGVAYGEDGGEYYVPVGLGQGVWQVVRHEAGAEAIQQVGDVTLVTADGSPPDTSGVVLELGELVSTVKR